MGSPIQEEGPAGRDQARGFRLGYRPSLDGFRGIAVLAVIAFHAHLLPGGFLGVDVFFVLSGFLITTLLLQEWNQSGAVNLKHFYARRALRLLPALSTLLLFWLLYIYFFKPEIFRETLKASLTTIFYCSNLATAFKWEVWLGPLSHTWSLSIEEQFYLIWPVLLISMLRLRLKPRSMLYLILFCASASAITRAALWAGGSHIYRMYSAADTRADALLVGCALGVAASYNLLPRARHIKPVGWLAAASAVFVAYLGVRANWDAGYMYLGMFTVAAIAVAVVLLYLLTWPAKAARWFLESPLLIWTGRVSYGLYLWHLPVNEMMTFSALPSPLLFALRLGVTFALAGLSFYLIEQPCLRIKGRFHAAKTVSLECTP